MSQVQGVPRLSSRQDVALHSHADENMLGWRETAPCPGTQPASSRRWPCLLNSFRSCAQPSDEITGLFMRALMLMKRLNYAPNFSLPMERSSRFFKRLSCGIHKEFIWASIRRKNGGSWFIFPLSPECRRRADCGAAEQGQDSEQVTQACDH